MFPHKTFAVASLALALLSAGAQTPGTPGPNLPVPEQTNVPQNLPLNPSLPTIFVVGDSTARNKADLGWGDHFAHYFDTTKVNVANRAIAGRSARSYMNEGAWDNVLAELKPGDYVLLQWGHNDGGGTLTPEFKGRGEGKGVGDESAEIPITTPFTRGPLAGKTTETIHTYGWYNRKYIADIRAKGANPILLTVTIRDIWSPGPDGKLHIEHDMGYRDFDMQIAASEHVPLVDMATRRRRQIRDARPRHHPPPFPHRPHPHQPRRRGDERRLRHHRPEERQLSSAPIPRASQSSHLPITTCRHSERSEESPHFTHSPFDFNWSPLWPYRHESHPHSFSPASQP